MLIDSGAQSCFVPRCAVKDDDITPINIDLVTPSGTRSDAIIGTVNYELVLRDTNNDFHQFPFSSYVFNNDIESSFILGCSFLRQNKLNIDLANNMLRSEDGIYCFPLIIGNRETELSTTTPKHVNTTQHKLMINNDDHDKMLSKLKTLKFMRDNKDEFYFSDTNNEQRKNKIKGKT